jgi:hypothetical protein
MSAKHHAPKQLLLSLRDHAWQQELATMCRERIRRDDVVVELGSYAGESTCVFAQAASAVFAIDRWDQSYGARMTEGCADAQLIAYLDRSFVVDMAAVERAFDARTAAFPNIVKIKADAFSAHGLFATTSIDFLYIDTVHSFEEVTGLIGLWGGKVKRGGFVAGHDHDSKAWPEVCAAVRSLYGEDISTYGDSSWCVRV